jgi:hypothetical protein
MVANTHSDVASQNYVRKRDTHFNRNYSCVSLEAKRATEIPGTNGVAQLDERVYLCAKRALAMSET